MLQRVENVGAFILKCGFFVLLCTILSLPAMIPFVVLAAVCFHFNLPITASVVLGIGVLLALASMASVVRKEWHKW